MQSDAFNVSVWSPCCHYSGLHVLSPSFPTRRSSDLSTLWMMMATHCKSSSWTRGACLVAGCCHRAAQPTDSGDPLSPEPSGSSTLPSGARREEGRGEMRTESESHVKSQVYLMLNHRFIISICTYGHLTVHIALSVPPIVHVAHLDTPHLDTLFWYQYMHIYIQYCHYILFPEIGRGSCRDEGCP